MASSRMILKPVAPLKAAIVRFETHAPGENWSEIREGALSARISRIKAISA